MPLDTDFIRFSREMKPTKQCKISQKNLRSDQGGGRTTAPPPKYVTGIYVCIKTGASFRRSKKQMNGFSKCLKTGRGRYYAVKRNENQLHTDMHYEKVNCLERDIIQVCISGSRPRRRQRRRRKDGTDINCDAASCSA